MTTDPIIYIDDIRKAGHCVAGAKRWFELRGLDFRSFVRDGIPASKLLAVDDELARQVVASKLERDHG